MQHFSFFSSPTRSSSRRFSHFFEVSVNMRLVRALVESGIRVITSFGMSLQFWNNLKYSDNPVMNACIILEGFALRASSMVL